MARARACGIHTPRWVRLDSARLAKVDSRSPEGLCEVLCAMSGEIVEVALLNEPSRAERRP